MPKTTADAPKLPESVVEHYLMARQIQPDLLPEEHLKAFEIPTHEAFVGQLLAAAGISQASRPGAVMEECNMGAAA